VSDDLEDFEDEDFEGFKDYSFDPFAGYDPPADDPVEPAESENATIRQLREQAARVDEAKAVTTALRREVALLRAGYDTDSKRGALFLKSFGPDVDDLEELVREAKAHGVPLLSAIRSDPDDNS
jgi:hypothetical protein